MPLQKMASQTNRGKNNPTAYKKIEPSKAPCYRQSLPQKERLKTTIEE